MATPLRARWFVPLASAVLGLIGACTLARTSFDPLPRELLGLFGCAAVSIGALVRRTRTRWPAALAFLVIAPLIQFNADLEAAKETPAGAAFILGLFGCFVSTLWIFADEDPVEPTIARAEVR
ncbi:MAG: hypothetical protein H0T79_23245 [Deltaproteobacteria bacterium]|nr:hypothetical protein [Deltaproteobacteria bacterium]